MHKRAYAILPIDYTSLLRTSQGSLSPGQSSGEYAASSLIQIILKYHWFPKELAGQIQLKYGCRSVSIPPPHM